MDFDTPKYTRYKMLSEEDKQRVDIAILADELRYRSQDIAHKAEIPEEVISNLEARVEWLRDEYARDVMSGCQKYHPWRSNLNQILSNARAIISDSPNGVYRAANGADVPIGDLIDLLDNLPFPIGRNGSPPRP